MTELRAQAILARQAALELATTGTQCKNDALRAMAHALRENMDQIIAANEADIASARERGPGNAFIERLTLDGARVEAMACGIPIIATESGGMPEYLAGSKALVLPRTPQLPQLLAQAIHQLYQSPQQCREMALAGTAVAQRYSPQAFYREFVAALHAQQALIP